jgi:surface polysaccharide O-acyltransferase-like enzyme
MKTSNIVSLPQETDSTDPVITDENMTKKSTTKTRMFFIDNLRVFLTILVILHHLSIVYGASGGVAYVEAGADDLATILLTLFTSVNAPYFMGFFFLIAGYFTPGSYDRKGVGRFLKDRLVRLGIPVVVYMFTIHPLIGYLVSRYHFGSSQSFAESYTAQIGGYARYGLGLGPLWFVALLLLFGIGYGLLRRLIEASTHSAATRATRVADAQPPSNLAIAGFALALGMVTFAVRIWFPIDEWVKIVVMYLEIAHLPQYLGLFALGIIAYRRDWFRTIPDRTGKVWLAIAIACIVLLPIIFIAGGVMEGKQDLFMGGVTWQAFITAIWEAFLCVGMVVGLLVLFRRRFNSQGPLLKGMATSAYATYIMHTLVLVLLGLALSAIQLPHLLKFILVAPVAVALSFLVGYGVKKLPVARNIV